jgi:ATP citrate (pro-S)-lyase
MSAKSILEADGKAILNYHLTRAPVIKPTPLPAQATHNPPAKLASITFAEGDNIQGVLDAAEATFPFLLAPGAKFVAKPDQLIKRRGKSGLLKLNATWPEAKQWVAERANKLQKVEHVEGYLRTFLVEPFVPHPQETEYYININSVREVSCSRSAMSNAADFRQNSTDFFLSRVTGFSFTTRVVLRSAMLTLRLRSSSFPWT